MRDCTLHLSTALRIALHPHRCPSEGVVGNSGLSLRRRSWMLRAIHTCPSKHAGLPISRGKGCYCAHDRQPVDCLEDQYLAGVLNGIGAPLPSASEGNRKQNRSLQHISSPSRSSALRPRFGLRVMRGSHAFLALRPRFGLRLMHRSRAFLSQPRDSPSRLRRAT